MLKTGVIILSVWAGFNFLLAVFILINLLFISDHPLISRVVFSDAELAELNPKTAAAIKSLAIMLNSSIAASTCFILIVLWNSMSKGQQWAFWGLLITGGFGQIMQFVGDAAIGNKTLTASIVMTAIFVVGIVLSGIGILRG